MDSTGVPYTGAHDITLALYESQSATTPMWQETLTTDFDSGYYAVQLGADSTNPLDDSLFEAGVLFVGFAVDGGAELPDRLVVSSTPFARRAAVAERVDGGVVDASSVQINGLTVIDGTGTFLGVLTEETLSGLACVTDQLPIYNGTSWSCTAGGLTALACTAGQIATYDGAGWICGSDSDTLVSLGCIAGDVVTFDGVDWSCEQPTDSGVSSWGDLGDIPGAISSIENLSCTDGQLLAWDDSSGEWSCETVTDTTLSQGTVISYITDSPISLAAGSTVGGSSIENTDTLGDLVCADGDVAHSSGGVWGCAAASLVDTVGSLSCSDGEIIAYSTTSSSWECETLAITDSDTLGSLSCSDGEIIAYNASSSSWECEVLAITDSDTLADLMCIDGDVAAWDDTSAVWECVELAMTDSDSLADLEVGCTSGAIPVWDGSYWTCADGTLASLSCTTDEVPLWDGSYWTCAPASTATPNWGDITGVPTALEAIETDGLAEGALPFTGLNEVSGGALDNEFTYDYVQDTPVVINDGQENNPSSSMATVPAIGPSLSILVTVDTLGNSDHAAIQYLLRHYDGSQIIDYTIVAYGDYSGSSTVAETWTVTETLDNMASTQSNLVYPQGTWTLLAFDNDDLPGNPAPGEDGSFTWNMQVVAVTPDMASVNGDLIVDDDLIVSGNTNLGTDLSVSGDITGASLDVSGPISADSVDVYGDVTIYMGADLVFVDSTGAETLRMNGVTFWNLLCDRDQDGYVSDDASCAGDDCDDTQSTINLGAADTVGDGVDQNCDGMDGEDTDQDGAASIVSGGTDCDDNDSSEFPGSSSSCPGSTCKTLLAAGLSFGDGDYWLDPNSTGAATFECDMTTDGGGWTGIAFPTADTYLNGTMVAVDSAGTEGIDPVNGPNTGPDGSGDHTYHYSFDFDPGYSSFYLESYQIKANAASGDLSDIFSGSFVQSDWSIGNSGSYGDVSFGDANASGPITSYAAQISTNEQCQTCTHDWPPGTIVFDMGATATAFRIGWGEGGGESEGWYPWYQGTIFLREP
jgi:hypothetical protein